MDGSSLVNSKILEYNGDLEISSTIISDWYASDISVSNILLPTDFALLPAYPNPFNPVTNISFDIPITSYVKIQIFDIQGRVVQVVYDNNINAGNHSISWNANAYPSGLYIIHMASEEFNDYQKIMLLK